MSSSADIMQYLPLLIPIILLQVALIIFALIDLVKRPRTRGPKWVWVVVIIFFNLFGPIAYFLFGRGEE